MDGGSEKRSDAFSINAAATLPDRCARRPDSFGNASKMPNVVEPMRIANQAIVSGSSSTSASPLLRKLSTSSSLPGFASSRTINATVTIIDLLLLSDYLRSYERTNMRRTQNTNDSVDAVRRRREMALNDKGNKFH